MLMTGERKQTKHKTKDDRTAGEEVLPVVQQIIYYVRILSVGVRKGSLSEWAAEDVLLAKLHLRFPFTTMLHTHRESWIMDSRTRMPNGNPLSLSPCHAAEHESRGDAQKQAPENDCISMSSSQGLACFRLDEHRLCINRRPVSISAPASRAPET